MDYRYWWFQKEKANNDHIKNLIYGFPCERVFVNINASQKVNILDKTIENVFSLFIPHEITVHPEVYCVWIPEK